MSSVRPSTSECTWIVGSTWVARDALGCASSISYATLHPELDGRTLDSVHSLMGENVLKAEFSTYLPALKLP